MAVAQIGYRYLIAPDWRAVVAGQVMPGPGVGTYEYERGQVTQNQAEPGELGQLAGFQFVTYSPATAVIELVSKFDNGGMQEATATVDWSEGDWKLQLTSSGSEAANAVPISSLVGFVPWAGV